MKKTAKQKSARKVRLVILAAVLFLVPMTLVGVIMFLNMDEDLGHGTVNSIEMSYEELSWSVKRDGNAKRDGNTDEVDFFVSVCRGGQAFDMVKPPEDYRCLKLSFHKLFGNGIPYELYISDSVNDCFYKSVSDGKVYHIASDKAEQLLVHPRVKKLISFASAPVCSLVTSMAETPTGSFRGEWTYVLPDDSVNTATVEETGEKSAVLPAGESMRFSFDIEPDFLSVQVFDEEEHLLSSGEPEELEIPAFEDDTPLTVAVTAKWFSEDKNYRGVIKYEFDVLFDVPTVCTLVNRQAAPGGVFEIRIEHSAAQPNEVAVTPLAFTPEQIQQYMSGTALVIKIHVPENVAPCESGIVLKSKDVDESFNVTVTAPEG